MTVTDFTHVFQSGTEPATARTLLLLHGTGGGENDLRDLGRRVAPGANLLGVRGQVLERGRPRFFRRLAEGVFDEDDLRRRTADLADWLPLAARQHGFDPAKVVALGYSNGANIAGALLLLRPGALSGAILLRPMAPLVPDPLPDLAGVPVLILAGAHDPLLPPGETDRLAGLLRQSGAAVTVAVQPAGHHLVPGDVEAAREWVAYDPGQ